MKITIPIDKQEDEPWYYLRGGSWRIGSGNLRGAFRLMYGGASDRNGFYCFRIVRSQK